MSTPRFRRATFAVAVLCLLGTFAVTPPTVQASSSWAVVGHIDQRIHQARHQIRHWDSRVHAWRRHVRRTRLRVRHVLAGLRKPPPVAADLGSARKAHGWLPSHPVVSARAALHHAIHSTAGHHAVAARRRWRLRLRTLRAAKVRILAALGGAGVTPSVHGPLTYERWARALLTSLGAPQCTTNLQIVVAWQTAESTFSRFNPLATEFWMPGAWTYGTSRVENYGSLAEGLQATRATLLMGSDSLDYAVVVDDLIDCAPAAVTASAIRASYWCHGCAHGAYVTGLLPEVLADWQGFSTRLVSGP
jgi:hypothetical protein